MHFVLHNSSLPVVIRFLLRLVVETVEEGGETVFHLDKKIITNNLFSNPVPNY